MTLRSATVLPPSYECDTQVSPSVFPLPYVTLRCATVCSLHPVSVTLRCAAVCPSILWVWHSGKSMCGTSSPTDVCGNRAVPAPSSPHWLSQQFLVVLLTPFPELSLCRTFHARLLLSLISVWTKHKTIYSQRLNDKLKFEGTHKQ